MEKTLLTKVVTQLVNERANAQEYGVALVNIPDFDYVAFALGLSSERKGRPCSSWAFLSPQELA